MRPTATILIAEDDPILREAYRRRFARTPYRITLACDGNEAIQHLKHSTPDLLICDILMPNADGWAVLESLPTGKKRPFPVIMLTNMEDDETIKRLKHYHVNHYLVKKDMTLRTLNELVASLLSPSS